METIKAGDYEDESKEIKVGDIVQLKSGGPFMTVNSTADGNVFCIWFSDEKECRSFGFRADVLQKRGNEEGLV